MGADRVAWAQATIAKAVEAVEAGLDVKADRIIRHAVHEGLHPIEIVLTALAAEPVEVQAGSWEPAPMVPVVYVGPEEGVALSPDAGGAWMAKGQPVELPEELARRLCDSPDFSPAKAAKRGRG
jgi:hypothetical protein